MADLVFPRLIDCDAWPTHHEGRPVIYVTSSRRLAREGVCVPRSLGTVLTLLDGRRSVEEICLEAGRLAGLQLELEVIEELLRALDGIYVLDTDRHHHRKREIVREFRAAGERHPVCAGGVYPDDPKELATTLDQLYTLPGGPGPPGLRKNTSVGSRLRGVLVPHMDYRRGRHSFAWGFKEIVERSSATTFVIIATSHYSLHRFVMTGKDFLTPAGRVRTNKDFVDLVADQYGGDVFEDEIAHQPEHSIELEVVLLQHALRDRPDFRIVPLLVGSFGDAVDRGRSPRSIEEIQRMICSLTSAEELCGEEVCYIISGDLAHLGPKFGDREAVTMKTSQWCRGQDERLLGELRTADSNRLFNFIAGEKDERRVCGFPPLYVGLSAAKASSGRVLCYDQFVDPAGREIVSFASMAFDAE